MRFHRLFSIALFASGLLAQEAPMFPTPSYLRRHFSTPSPKVELQAPVRLADFEVGGKLELSLRAYLELVLANNTDIAISKLSVETQKNAIMRAFGAFDPALTASFDSTRAKQPATDVLQGASVPSSLSQPATFSYQQRLQTGTTFTVGFNANKSSTNSGFATFNPALNATMSFTFTQPLLRDRGSSVTKLPILIARSQLRSSEHTLADTLMRQLVTAENAYWDVVQARENLRVQEQSLALSDAFLKRSQRELELGALSPLDIFQPQAEYASAEIRVSQAKFVLAQREDALRRQFGADLDPKYRNMPIVLTESVLPPSDSAQVDREAAVAKAISMRADLKALRVNLDINDLNIRSATNALRPDLSLTGRYSAVGRGGTFYQRTNVFDETGERSTVVNVIPGGFGDALDQLFGFGFPTYGFRLSLRLPIRDRAAAAGMADALVNKKTTALRIRSLEESIRLDVLNAISQVESSKDSVKLATVARDLAQKSLDAEQRKYELGANIPYIVLQAQNSLNQAESRLLTESINYRKNLLNLLRTTGELLDERGVVIK